PGPTQTTAAPPSPVTRRGITSNSPATSIPLQESQASPRKTVFSSISTEALPLTAPSTASPPSASAAGPPLRDRRPLPAGLPRRHVQPVSRLRVPGRFRRVPARTPLLSLSPPARHLWLGQPANLHHPAPETPGEQRRGIHRCH